MRAKTWAAVMMVLFALSLMLNVASAANLIEIQAYLNNGIRLVLHGELFEAKAPDGTKQVPITYRGSTYLPLRAVAEAVGLEVTWDANTNTAYLGEVGGEIAKDAITYTRVTPEFAPSGSDLYKLASRTPEYLNRAPDRTFEYGYSGTPGYQAGISLFVQTNYEYDKFKATFWVDEEKDEYGEYLQLYPSISFTDENGVLVQRMDVEFGNLYEVEVDIKDVQQLEVWVSGGLSIIGEPMIGK